MSVTYEVLVSLFNLSARLMVSLTRNATYYINAEMIVISVT